MIRSFVSVVGENPCSTFVRSVSLIIVPNFSFRSSVGPLLSILSIFGFQILLYDFHFPTPCESCMMRGFTRVSFGADKRTRVGL
jgi:hypothetical protein